MKVFFVALLLLILSCSSAAQKMTDRDLAGLKDRVKQVKEWWQDYGPDGKPVGKLKARPETTYDNDGNTQLITSSYGKGEFRKTYFKFKNDRVSKDESTREPVIPNRAGIIIRPPEKFKGPYNSIYRYKYDKNGRIIEIMERNLEHAVSSSTKYVYDNLGRIELEKYSAIDAKIESSESYKYDDNGNRIEWASETRLITEDGKKNISTITHYSDYAFDKNGNWVKRTGATLNKKGEVEKVFAQVREITYF